MDELNAYVNAVEGVKHVISITEDWMKARQLQTTKLGNYLMGSCFLRTTRIHGGSCIFVLHGSAFTEMENLKRKSIESIIECSSIELSVHSIIIINIYRPPLGDADIFFDTFQDTLSTAFKTKPKHKIIIAGDFNIDF